MEKKVLGDLPFAYAVEFFHTDHGLRAVAASEGEGGAFWCDLDGGSREQIWENAGGTMTICQLNANGDFLAVQNFFKGFQSQTARIVHCRRRPAGWFCEKVLDLPYVHRFGAFDIGGELWLLACTLCEKKEFRADWSSPGKVLAGRLDLAAKTCDWHAVVPALTKNHGWHRVRRDGRDIVLVSGMEGVYRIDVPRAPGEAWTSEMIHTGEISDIALYDLDGDGEDELLTFEPFHGNLFRIHKRHDGEWKMVYGYPVEFGHAVWCGDIGGRPSVLMGYRQENAALVLMQKKDGPAPWSMDITFIDENEAPTNIAVDQADGVTRVLCAGGARQRVLLYEIRP